MTQLGQHLHPDGATADDQDFAVLGHQISPDSGTCWKYRSYLCTPPACSGPSGRPGCALLMARSPPQRGRGADRAREWCVPSAQNSVTKPVSPPGLPVCARSCAVRDGGRRGWAMRAAVRTAATPRQEARRRTDPRHPVRALGSRRRARRASTGSVPDPHAREPATPGASGQRRPRRSRTVTTPHHQVQHLLVRRIAVPLPRGFQRRQIPRKPVAMRLQHPWAGYHTLPRKVRHLRLHRGQRNEALPRRLLIQGAARATSHDDPARSASHRSRTPPTGSNV